MVFLKNPVAKVSVMILVCLSLLTGGCEEVDLMLVSQAGVDAVKAVTLSEEAVRDLATQTAQFSDSQNKIAAGQDKYARRLQQLTDQHTKQDGFEFNFKVYLTPEINAFAMADGTIRIYSGLMDMMDDQELLFVIGHEVGHVVKDHVRKKIRLAYAGQAVRKGVASINNEIGAIAGSQIGGFVEKLLNAQFSQQEEREADDYGLFFLENTGNEPKAAVSALRKLATLGNNHSFLSSHPAPGARAERLETRKREVEKGNE
ncbi:MAG: M48 family metallopeptidase [Desulfobulbaceae bacterium]|uniref:M48 family metallopeptidase n=1 Tax=Candidatus Desulfobia pelagia TaxID=2841692 RepID=A0A8J6NAE1_9BACT|nr:M48 family metallopeptidase [Candidatus Desulfobia pelagia]